MQIDTKRLLTAGIFAGLLIGGTSTGALASHDGGGSYSSSGSASSYINGDAGANADHSAVFDEHARRSELREKIDTHPGDDRRHPTHHLTDRDHVVAVVL